MPKVQKKSKRNLFVFLKEKSNAPPKPRIIHNSTIRIKEKSGEKIKEKFRTKLAQEKKNRRKEQKNPRRKGFLFDSGLPDCMVK